MNMGNTPGSSPLIDAARNLAPLLREYADRAEGERRLPDEVAAAFAKAGIFRMCTPKEIGGLETDPLTMSATIEELARVDGSLAWCAMIIGAGGVNAALFSREGAAEAFAESTAGSFAPTGMVVETPDGYRITGRWAFMSGIHASKYVGCTGVLMDGDKPHMTPFGPQMVIGMVPVGEGTIHDTWHVAGLRGTGSHDFEVQDVLVPRTRATPIPPREPPAFTSPLYRFPLWGFLSLSIASCAVGIARGAIDELTRMAKTKTPFGMMSSLSTRATAQVAVSQAEASLLSGRAMLHSEVAAMWDRVTSGTPPTPPDRARLRIAATNAVTSAAHAVDLVYTAGGGSAVYAKSPLQRSFRDVHAITQHTMVAPHGYELFGKILLGVEPDHPLL
ncbi:MAG: acyl-CoA dehydrogenase family protein [Labilithrix sp.]|nr:acyl-CoA dehydrogenase family protein [Labilithrix sp.]MCW5812988.1 acyl-CoA dehydrogenase family protein [Labilithrix sp.]